MFDILTILAIIFAALYLISSLIGFAVMFYVGKKVLRAYREQRAAAVTIAKNLYESGGLDDFPGLRKNTNHPKPLRRP